MTTALCLIATGQRYWPYIQPLLDSVDRYFVPCSPILFTDCPQPFCVARRVVIPDAGYPETTLRRYHTLLEERTWLAAFDLVFYCDIDMRFCAPVTEDDIASTGITATIHPGYVRQPGPYETRPESAAYVYCGRRYYCGGFVGGTAASFLAMAEDIRAAVDRDAARGLLAVWHDESHLNRYLHQHPPAREVTPSFCYPDENRDYYRERWGRDYEPKLLALVKPWSH